MPKKPAKDEKDSVMDVSKPGKAEPSASSRPIIVSRKPIIEDPMVRKGSNDDLIPGPPAVDTKQSRLHNLKRSNSINISPEGELKSDSDKAETEEKPKDSKLEKQPEEKEEKSAAPNLPAVKEVIENDHDGNEVKTPESEPEAAPVAKKVKIEPPKPEEKKDDESKDGDKSDKDDTDKDPPGDEKKDDDSKDEKTDENEEGRAQVQETTGLVDELAKQAANKKQKQEDEKAQQAKSEQLDKLVSGKKYFLPIGQVTRRRNNRNALIILVLLLVLALVVADLAVDAGLVKTNIQPLTDLFPN